MRPTRNGFIEKFEGKSARRSRYLPLGGRNSLVVILFRPAWVPRKKGTSGASARMKLAAFFRRERSWLLPSRRHRKRQTGRLWLARRPFGNRFLIEFLVLINGCLRWIVSLPRSDPFLFMAVLRQRGPVPESNSYGTCCCTSSHRIAERIASREHDTGVEYASFSSLIEE